jgi:predicted signal transduction protein with EAL and GGDEF domain
MAKRRIPQTAPGIRAPGSPEAPAAAARPDPRPALMAPISPTLRYALMTGTCSELRLRGWVKSAHGDPDPAIAWAAHRHQLVTEAAAHDFQPFALTKTRPTGDGFERWHTQFLKLYQY